MLGLANNVDTNVASVIHTTEQTISGELSLFAKSDKKIMDEIYTTHVHADDSFDDDSLFMIVENILKRATQTVDKIVQGNQVHAEGIEEKIPKANFSVPLCTLKGIACEMQCNPPGVEIAHKTTLAILNKLSKYSWEAKASLTLAAFAMEFGEFWLLAELRESNPLAKSIAILKRVPVPLKPSQLQKRRPAILELNGLIKATLQVIECIDQFGKLSINYPPKDVPALSIALEHTPVDIYWAIMAVVACATKVTLLTSDEDKEFDLSRYSGKIRDVLANLKAQLDICHEKIEEEKNYRKILDLLRRPTEVMEVLKALLFTKDNVQPLIDGSTKQTVNIDVLKRKNVLLFFSGLDITDEDISILKPIHELTKKENQYKIVWIPIVERWTDDLRKKFEILKNKMPWFTVQHFGSRAGLRVIKEEWNFKGKPALVVMNPQGKVENLNAFPMIRVSGENAFPALTGDTCEGIYFLLLGGVILYLLGEVIPALSDWVRENKYIFYYGGKDNEWVQQFTKKASALANDPILKEAKIHIELVNVGKNSKGEDDIGILGRFWTGIESLFLTKADKQVDSATQEIQKLLSYKNESGWAVLTKGSTVLVTGYGKAVLRVVEDFEKWKKQVKDEEGFEFCLKDYYLKVIGPSPPCCRVDIPGSTGKVPESMKCPHCHRSMETYISYKCCHIDGPTAHH